MSYSVWVWYSDGFHMAELEHVEIEVAARKAISLWQNVGARIGIVRRITIVDNSEDTTIFEWKFGEGVTYPSSGDTGNAFYPTANERPTQ